MLLDTQRKILKKFCIDKRFATKYIDYIEVDFFENLVHQKIFKELKRYFYQFNKLPTQEVIKEWLNNDELAMLELNKLNEIEIYEDEWLESKCQEFILYSRTKDAVLKTIEILEKQKNGQDVDYSVIRSYFDEALKVSFEEEGYKYFDEEKIRERLSKDVVATRIPTGIRALDAVLEGGLAKGELGIVAGITGFGKTMFLQNVAASCCFLGKSVIYYSFENKEEDLARRFDKIFTKMTESEIYSQKDKFYEKLIEIYTKKKAELIIKWYPMYFLTPYALKNDILDYQSKGLNIGLVVVDYAQRMKAPRTYSDRWQELIMIYDLLASIAIELNIPIWTAIQVVKSALKVDVPDLLHVSGARDVMNSADIGLSIAQTKEEREKGEMRLFVMKARRVGARKLINLKVNYETFIIRSASVLDYKEDVTKSDVDLEAEDWDFFDE